ncbi:pre-mRNA processing factor 3-domain-containing protein [Mycena filopes]|nr:pre-mRNA processing factor 3-domain-containing protein [Mycena filopes]
MSDKKRPFDGNGETSMSKKLRSSDKLTNGTPAAPALTGAALIAQKRAEIAAKLAAMKNPALGLAAPVPVKAVPMKHSPTVSSGPTPASGSGSATPAPSADAINKRIKRLVEDAHSRLAVKDNPYMSMPQSGKNKARPTEVTQQGAGLKMAAHPLLLDTTPAAPQSKKDRYKPMQPKFASIKANTRNIPTPPPAPPPVVVESTNPYASASTSKDTTLFEGAPKDRSNRNFRFNPKGKYVALGNQMRQDNQLEALKQRIAESARKAGLDGDMGIERGIKRLPPPEAEWWDQPLLPNRRYADVDDLGITNLNIRTSDSPITIYIQHPIPIPAPGDKNKVALKPMMLTKKEQKKMRKLKRAADLQDKRDRVAMGLIPPDPPKVRLANMMTVLTSDAVQDPTRVEARIRREVAQRRHGHEKMNAARKLTAEQRREKVETKKAEEDKRGIYGAVFKIKTLSDPAHRWKVRKNAEQLNLTGLCIFNPHFSMVYVEGAAKFIRNYKRLMMTRIAWTEAARPRGAEDVVLETSGSGAEDGEGAQNAASGSGQRPQEGTPASLEGNKCYLVWEGMLRDRSFSGFNSKTCPTDGTAKEVLGDKLKGYWDQAKNWKAEEEELL